MAKRKAGIIASALATCAVCGSLIAGSTYALFTSEDSVNISVTTGTVDLVATIDKTSLTTSSTLSGWKATGAFENGGSATWGEEESSTLTDNGTKRPDLTLNNVTPGDVATFDILVTNNSTVNIQYKISWSVKGELAGALVADADGASFGAWSDWSVPEKDSDKSKTISVSVELPKEAGNEYQNKSASIVFAVEAVQGNADVSAPGVTVSGIKGLENVKYASLDAAYEAVHAKAESLGIGFGQETCDEETFNAMFSDGNIVWTIYGEQHVTNPYTFSFGRQASRFNNGLNIESISVVGGATNAELIMDTTVTLPYDWWYTQGDPAAKTVTFNATNLTISEGTATSIKFEPAWGHNFKATYRNCVLNGNIHYLWNNETDLTFDRCVFNNKQAGSGDSYALMVQGGGDVVNDSKVTIKGCTVNGFKRGINLDRPRTDFVIEKTTVNNLLEEDRPAFQISQAKSVLLDGNTVNSPEVGCAVKLHAKLITVAPDCEITIKNNNFNAKYLICEETSSSAVKVTWENNTLSNKLSIATEGEEPTELESAK